MTHCLWNIKITVLLNFRLKPKKHHRAEKSHVFSLDKSDYQTMIKWGMVNATLHHNQMSSKSPSFSIRI